MKDKTTSEVAGQWVLKQLNNYILIASYQGVL